MHREARNKRVRTMRVRIALEVTPAEWQALERLDLDAIARATREQPPTTLEQSTDVQWAG